MYLRIWQIVGDKKRGIAAIIPISKSSWWKGVKNGQYPKPIKLSERTTVWLAEEVYKIGKTK